MDTEQKNEQTVAQKSNKRLLRGIIAYAVIFTFLLIISNIGTVNGWIDRVLLVLRPILIGLVIAYLTNPFFRFFERKLLARIPAPYLRRVLAMILTYILFFLAVFALIMLVFPQLFNSIQSFVDNFEARLSRLIVPVNQIISGINSRLPVKEDGSGFLPLWNRDGIVGAMESFWNYLQNILKEKIGFSDVPRLLDFLSATASGLLEVIFGVFFSIYLLFSKEKRHAQIMKLRRALFKDSTNMHITRAFTVADRSFGGFLRGKILDSLIVGVLTFLACRLIGIQDALLVAAIVGITDIIPVVGPFIGVIPTALIILLDDPIKVIFFLISIVVIQQLDGNLIAPKILGENTGVSSLCVMIAILLMGGIWGFAGMLIGVPLFATVLELLDYWLDSRLKARNLPNNTESYYSPSAIAQRSESAFERRRRKARQKREARNAKEETGSGDLNFGERVRLRTYQTARKYHLFSDISEEDLQSFLEEESRAIHEADETPEETPQNTASEPVAEQPSLDSFLTDEPAAPATESEGKEAGDDEQR